MLKNSFFFLEGLDRSLEQVCYESGCTCWYTLLSGKKFLDISKNPKLTTAHIHNTEKALSSKSGDYFAKHLPTSDTWRTWPDFKDHTVYLDIETDGKSHTNAITAIGLYDNKGFRCLIQGQNLNQFPSIISNYELVVTFYGTGFDLPMLRKKFPEIKMPPLHWDLYFSFKSLGYKGGLKKIEQQLGIARSDDTEGLTGKDAVLLWNRYMQGDMKAIDTLIQYNKEDVVNLETLAGIAFQKHKEALSPNFSQNHFIQL